MGHHDAGLQINGFCFLILLQFLLQLWFDRWWFGLFDSIWHRAHGYAGKTGMCSLFLATRLSSLFILQDGTTASNRSVHQHNSIWSSWFWAPNCTLFLLQFLLQLWFDRWWFGLFDSVWHRAHGYAGKTGMCSLFLATRLSSLFIL